MDYNNRQRISSYLFERVTAKYLKLSDFADDVIQIETRKDDLLNDLDITAGIDAFIKKDGKFYTAASRVKHSLDTPLYHFNTFTFRHNDQKHFHNSKTEYEKLMETDGTAMFPYYTIQSFIDLHQKEAKFYIAKTLDLKTMLENNWCQLKHTTQAQDHQSFFYVVQFDQLVLKGFDLLEIKADLKKKLLVSKKILLDCE